MERSCKIIFQNCSSKTSPCSRKPIEYSEYCSILSQLPVNKFGWGIEGFAKLDLDANGSISPEEIEAAFGKSKKKREKLEALEKNNDGKISLAEFLHCWEHEPRPRTVPYKVRLNRSFIHSGKTGKIVF